MKQLCLLHGFMGGPESWLDALDGLQTALPDAQVLTPHLSGHGKAPSLTQDFESELERLKALLDRQGFQRGVLAGYSLGARIALGFTLRYPAAVSHLVLISGQPGLSDEAERRARSEADDAWAEQLEQRGLLTFVDAWEKLPLFASQVQLSAARLAAQRALRLSHVETALAQSLRAFSPGRMPNYWPALHRLACPVSLMAGELDAKFVEIARRFQTLHASSALKVVAGAGHNLLLEAVVPVTEVLASAAQIG